MRPFIGEYTKMQPSRFNRHNETYNMIILQKHALMNADFWSVKCWEIDTLRKIQKRNVPNQMTKSKAQTHQTNK